MAARHMTGTEFLSETGFGQLGVGVVAQFPEYPPHNTKLTALLHQAKPGDESAIQSVVGLLQHARQSHEQGNFAAEQHALVQADQLLDQLLAGGTGRGRSALLIVVVLAVAAFLLTMFWSGEKKPRRRLPPPRRNPGRRRRRAAKSKLKAEDGDADGDDDAADEDADEDEDDA